MNTKTKLDPHFGQGIDPNKSVVQLIHVDPKAADQFAYTMLVLLPEHLCAGDGIPALTSWLMDHFLEPGDRWVHAKIPDTPEESGIGTDTPMLGYDPVTPEYCEFFWITPPMRLRH